MRLIAASIALILISVSSTAEPKLGAREVVLENDQVQVVRLTYPVGTESGMHTHEYPNRAVYFVKGGTLELIPDDPSRPADELSVPDGKALFLPSTTHNVRNIGDAEVVIIETEIK